MRIKKKRILILVIFMVIIVGGIYFLYHEFIGTKGNSNFITFKQEKPVVEYGAKVDTKSFVKNSEGTIQKYPIMNTMRIGNQKIIYVVNKKGKEKDVPYTVEVKDTQKPILKLKNDTIAIPLNAKFEPATLIQEAKDPVDGKLYYSASESKGRYTISSNVNTSKLGSYTVHVRGEDNNGNLREASCKVSVVKENSLKARVVKQMYINEILLVNKEFGLPKDFGNGLEPQVKSALSKLQQGAKAAGYSMPIVSSFRSYDTQIQLFNDYAARDGYDKANTYSSHPGHSEHQSGLAADVGAIDNNYGSTPAGKWLQGHCADYGFIIRYVNGKEKITGYQYEPWHIRYVGKDVAKTIMERGITLEEYLGIQK